MEKIGYIPVSTLKNGEYVEEFIFNGKIYDVSSLFNDVYQILEQLPDDKTNYADILSLIFENLHYYPVKDNEGLITILNNVKTKVDGYKKFYDEHKNKISNKDKKLYEEVNTGYKIILYDIKQTKSSGGRLTRYKKKRKNLKKSRGKYKTKK